jgi:uncharacterized protein
MRDIDWLPYFGPMLGFAAVLALGDYAPAGSELALLIARAAAPAGIFLFFYTKGRYPELKGCRLGGASVLDVAVGLGVAALWVGPYLLLPGLRPGGEEAFDPGQGSMRSAMLALRFLGFVAVTPIVEELLVRSFLMRAVDVYDTDRDFRDVPIGTFAWRSFLVTVAWFTFTHAQWEWPVAFLTGVTYNLWLYRRKDIGALILTHAVTNAALFAIVVWGGETLSQWLGERLDLWYFL